MAAKNQDDIVKESLGFKEKELTRKVMLPGLQELHTKPIADIAEALSLVLRSEGDIVELKYRVGQFIEVTYRP